MAQESRISNLLMIVAVTCALVTTGLVVRRDLFQRSNQGPQTIPTDVPDWHKYLQDGRVIGNVDAPVKVIEFLDFQCPFCKEFAQETWPELKKEFADNVALVVRHWPLAGHKHAKAAARAAECAAAQGRFEQFHNQLFEQQELLGEKDFVKYAKESGVADLEAFERCANSTSSLASIDRTREEALDLGFTGTPAVLVNNKAVNFPSLQRLRSLIRGMLKQN